MKVKIKKTCTACGLCADFYPEVFEIAWDAVQITVDEVPQKLKESVRQAANECPCRVIVIE